MVVALVATLSTIYVSQILHQRINSAYELGDFVANEILHSSQDALEQDFSSMRFDPNDPAAVREAIAESLQTDAGLNSVFESALGYAPAIIDVAIIGNDGHALLHSNPNLISKPVPPRPEFDAVRQAGLWRQVQLVYGAARVYDVRVPLARGGEPFGSIRVGISTTLLKNELKPPLDRAIVFSAIAIFVSLLLAAGLSNFALRPLETISRQLDAMTGPAPPALNDDAPRPRDEVGA